MNPYPTKYATTTILDFGGGSSNSSGSSSKPTFAAKRWRKAFNVINSCRMMQHLVHKIKVHEEIEIVLSAVSRSPSYTTLCVQPQDDDDNSNESGKNGGYMFLQVDDPEAVRKVVREKDMDSLSRLGGIQGIAAALETDAEKGIHGNAEDINRRKEVLR